MGDSIREPFRVNLAAGAAAALVGVASFGVFHTLWIADVPAVFAEGLLFAAPAAVAWAWTIRITPAADIHRRGIGAGLVVGFLFWLTLVPYEIVGILWGPWTEPSSTLEALGILWIALLGVPVGSAIGWRLTRTKVGAIAWGLAALASDFSLGGAIAFFGGRDTMLGLFLWLLPTYLMAGVVLVIVNRQRRCEDDRYS